MAGGEWRERANKTPTKVRVKNAHGSKSREALDAVTKRLLNCSKVSRTSLDHLLLGKCADVDKELSHGMIIFVAAMGMVNRKLEKPSGIVREASMEGVPKWEFARKSKRQVFIAEELWDLTVVSADSKGIVGGAF